MGRSNHDFPYSNRNGRRHQDREDKRFLHRLERRMGRKTLDDVEPEHELPDYSGREIQPPDQGGRRHRPLQD